MSTKGYIVTKFLQGKFPNWVYRLVGKKLAAKIGLNEENKMADETLDTKPKWKSKTVWIAVVGVILGAITPISTALGHPIEIPGWVLEILIAMGLYTARTSTTTIK